MTNIYIVTERSTDDSLDETYVVHNMWEAMRLLLQGCNADDDTDVCWPSDNTMLVLRNGRVFARIEEVQLEV